MLMHFFINTKCSIVIINLSLSKAIVLYLCELEHHRTDRKSYLINTFKLFWNGLKIAIAHMSMYFSYSKIYYIMNNEREGESEKKILAKITSHLDINKND